MGIEINGISVKEAVRKCKSYICKKPPQKPHFVEVSDEVRSYFDKNWDEIGEILVAYNKPLNIAQKGNLLLLNTGAYTSSLNVKDIDFSDKASDKIMDTIIDNLVRNKCKH